MELFRITNAEDTFNQLNDRKSNWRQRARENFRTGNSKKLSLGISLFIQELWKKAILSPEHHIGNIFTEV